MKVRIDGVSRTLQLEESSDRLDLASALSKDPIIAQRMIENLFLSTSTDFKASTALSLLEDRKVRAALIAFSQDL